MPDAADASAAAERPYRPPMPPLWTGLVYAWWVVLFTTGLFYCAAAASLLRLLLGSDRSHRPLNVVYRHWAWWCAVPAGIRLRQHQPPPPCDRPTIILCNHRSQLDIPLTTLSHRHVFSFVAKAELSKIPLLGWILKTFHIMVDRKNLRSRGSAMQRLEDCLSEGRTVVVFPEGRRHSGPEPLGEFTAGPFQVARRGGYRLALLTLVDTGAAMPPGRLRLRPARIEAFWDLVEPDALGEASARTLRDHCRDLMRQRWETAQL
jgi:1-acyl-sn-glycerol-3-phosphate acyltransferase